MKIEEQAVCVTAQMMIRKPVATVFNALIDPAITTRFWFTKSSGVLEVGKPITWEWEMYGASAIVVPGEIIKNRLIAFTWGDPPVMVEFSFSSQGQNETYVEVKNYGFQLSGTELIAAVIDNTGGFTTMLDNMKAYLEYGIQLNLVQDKFPQALKAGYIENRKSQKAIVEKYMDGFRKTDHQQILDCLTEDVVWEMPGYFRHEGIKAFDGEIENPDADGHPDITIDRMIEEGNIVVAEGSVMAKLRSAPPIHAVFCDVFYFREGKICKLSTYLMMKNNSN